MEYESLEPYVDRQLADLPESIRHVMNPIRKMFWDGANLEGRIRLAKEHASQNDPALLNSRQILAQSAYDEVGLNGASIAWRYWVHQMPTLSAAEAARLMSALDPDKFSSLHEFPGMDDPSQHCEKAGNIQRLAERLGMAEATPSAWLAWADEREIHVHVGFRIEVEHLVGNPQQASPAEVSKQTEAKQSPVPSAEPFDESKSASGSAWRLKTTIVRFPGYRLALFHFLKGELTGNKSIPSAQEILNAWEKAPPDRIQVIPSKQGDELQYCLESGKRKTVDLKAVQAAIWNLVEVV